ncbi:MAG: type II secretion system protein GspF [Bdellovibrionales bacterium CG10_big_fil_rev_8_21_14_0_10_45_34]|nr:MAG: type II secretion system protein GspF [Bdellovibrionales bacterium CG10_big_fil_rev_8_21_14_0_10_45_34]
MALFEYRGLKRDGKPVRGAIDADNQRTARARLKKEGVFLQEIKAKKTHSQKKSSGFAHGGKVGVKDMSMMFRQLATLVKAEVPLVESLSAVAEQVEHPLLKACLTDIRDMVNEGNPLYKAMQKYNKIFNRIQISMVEAAEATGALGVILIRLAEFLEAQNELNSKVASAMFYPIIMLIMTVGMLFGLFIYVIPKITEIFEQSELTLPWYSQLVIDMSGFMVEYWHVLGVSGLALAFLFRNWKNTPKGSDQWDAILLKLPVVGKLTRMIAVSRFTRTLSTLLAGSVPIVAALDIVKNVVGNSVLAKAISEARDNISEGESVAVPLRKSGEFPPIVTHMITIGEKTGEIESMLTQVSDSYDFQVKNSIQALTSVLEPIMIVIMGGIIGVIVFAVVVPMMELSNIAR